MQATGWGKSAVYWIAAAAARDAGAGPTLVVSPLLALMRDQVAAAARAGLRAVTLNSANFDDWDAIVDDVRAGDGRRAARLAGAPGQPAVRRHRAGAAAARARPAGHRRGALHLRLGPRLPPRLPAPRRGCCSPTPTLPGPRDDGHRERPGDRRRRGAARRRHRSCCAGRWPATRCACRSSPASSALERLRLGRRRAAARCPARASSTRSPSPRPSGSPASSRRAATTSRPTPASSRPDDRARIEDALRRNELKAVVATSALGMGYDKPDLAFCVHVGSPGLAGRLLPAGRAGRPRARLGGRRAAAGARPTSGSGTTSPPRASPTRSAADRVLERAARTRTGR